MIPTQQVDARPDIAESLEQLDRTAQINNFVGLQLFPSFEVREQNGNFGVRPLASYFRNLDIKRASRSAYKETSGDFRDMSYATNDYGLVGVVDDRNAKIYDEYFDAEVEEAADVQYNVLLAHEKRVSDIITSTYVPVNVTNWAPSTADIIGKVEEQRQAMWDETLIKPNTLTVNWKDFQFMKSNDGILERIASSGAGDSIVASRITARQIAEVLELDQVLVSEAGYDAGGEGDASDIQPIFAQGRTLLSYVSSSGSLRAPTLGKTIHWGEDGSSIGGVIESWYDRDKRATKIRVRMETQELIVWQQLGRLLNISATQ